MLVKSSHLASEHYWLVLCKKLALGLSFSIQPHVTLACIDRTAACVCCPSFHVQSCSRRSICSRYGTRGCARSLMATLSGSACGMEDSDEGSLLHDESSASSILGLSSSDMAEDEPMAMSDCSAAGSVDEPLALSDVSSEQSDESFQFPTEEMQDLDEDLPDLLADVPDEDKHPLDAATNGFLGRSCPLD